MAIYHLHGQLIQRTAGQSAVRCAAYRSGERLHDRRLDEVCDFTLKSDVDESLILGPAGAPAWLFERETLWNTVEAAERSNGQPAREFDIALPIELVRADPRAAKDLMRRWANDLFVAHRLMVDINFHGMRTHNPHAHIMATTRPVVPFACEYEVGSKRVFGNKARHLNDRRNMDVWRETWAGYANATMAERGIEARIDHRRLGDQQIFREPQIHVGADASAMVRRGLHSNRDLKNRGIAYRNIPKMLYSELNWTPLSPEEQAVEDAVREGIPVYQSSDGEWVILDQPAPETEKAKALNSGSKQPAPAPAPAEECSPPPPRYREAYLAPMLAEERAAPLTSPDPVAEYEREIGWYDHITAYSAWLEQDVANERANLEETRQIEARGDAIANPGVGLENSLAAAGTPITLDLDCTTERLDRAMEAPVTASEIPLGDVRDRADLTVRQTVAYASTELDQALAGLANEAPNLQKDRQRFPEVSETFNAVVEEGLLSREKRLSDLPDRLEDTRPSLGDKTMAATDVAKAIGGGILEDARLIAISTAAVLGRGVQGATGRILSFTEGVGAAAVKLFSRDDNDTGRGRPPVEEKIDLSSHDAATPAKAIDLVYDDIFLTRLRDRQPIAFKRKEGRWVIDEKKFDDWMRARIVDHADHPLVRAEVETAVGKRTEQLLELLGSCKVPFLERRGGQVVILTDVLAQIAPGLAPHAHELIEHAPVVARYVPQALERWSPSRNSQPTSVAGEIGQSAPDIDRAQARQEAQDKSASSPDADDERLLQQAHHLSKSRPGRSAK